MPLPPIYKFRSIPALIELYTKFGSDPMHRLLSRSIRVFLHFILLLLSQNYLALLLPKGDAIFQDAFHPAAAQRLIVLFLVDLG